MLFMDLNVCAKSSYCVCYVYFNPVIVVRGFVLPEYHNCGANSTARKCSCILVFQLPQ